MIANDRRADCNHTFRSAEMSNIHARCTRGKIKANNMADIEKEILLQFIPSFSPKATTTSASKLKKTPLLTSNNIHEETRYIKFFACNHDHKIADDRRRVFPHDRRTFCDLRSSAIIWKPAFNKQRNIVTLVIQLTIINDLFHNLFSL